MKKALFMVLTAVLVVGMSGCCSCFDECSSSPNSCDRGRRGRGTFSLRCGRQQASYPTPYPYYTTRGPRDFLAADPRPIGP